MQPNKPQGPESEQEKVLNNARQDSEVSVLGQRDHSSEIESSWIRNRLRISEEWKSDPLKFYEIQNEKLWLENQQLKAKLQENIKAQMDRLKKAQIEKKQMQKEARRIKQLTDKNALLVNRIKELTDENALLVRMNANNDSVRQNRISDLSNQLKQFAYYFSEKVKEVEKLQLQLAESRSQNKLNRELIDQTRSRLKNSQSSIEQKDQEIRRLSSELTEAKKQVGEKQTQIQKKQEQLLKSVDNIEEKGQEIERLNRLVKQTKEKTVQQWNRNIAKRKEEFQAISIDSIVLQSEEQFEGLCGMFSKDRRPKGFKLLFRASDYGFDVIDNKKKYCGVAHTVLLVKTEYGKVIGGYTPLKWKIMNEEFGYQWSKDTSGESFVFSISNNHKLTLQSPTENEALYHDNFNGPTFCNGVGIKDKSNTTRGSYSFNKQYFYYAHPEYKDRDTVACTKFVGSSDGHFRTQQWEVHQVIFEDQS